MDVSLSSVCDAMIGEILKQEQLTLFEGIESLGANGEVKAEKSKLLQYLARSFRQWRSQVLPGWATRPPGGSK